MEEGTHKSQHTQGEETITRISGLYKDWFLDYASYVILERAVPNINDGFKPVQRRILHAMKELDDGRYNKVANVVGHTMQYHPHGDTSIADAMVQIGQKELLIDMQGNWGNTLTGDSAAASRYIEARLSKFALEVIFNPKTTHWQSSYDGRKKEPIHLPVKFPLLLAQGAEGIAVGLSTKIVPHNFNELISASIKHLQGKDFIIYPDFITGGSIDVTNYNDGKRGGKIRVRAKITQLDKNALVISEIPFGTTTSSLIDSILKANDKGKIKIKKIEDNTASKVEILVLLPTGISPDKTIDALYAFTQCENSISPLCCIIKDEKPVFLGVSDILRQSTDHTVELLKKELEIQLAELEEQWHFASLERIFIENKIYRDIEDQSTWDGVIKAIDKGLQPYIKNLKRAVTEEDIVRLTEIRIKRISKFDIDKAAAFIESLEDKVKQVNHHLENLIQYAVDYFKELKKRYGKDKNRKTEIKLFDEIEASKVVIRNSKLYVDREEGFIGTALKKSEYITDCSDIDEIIVFKEDGTMLVTKVGAKVFVGKGIIHVAVFKKYDKRTIYNMIYRDGKLGPSYIKRFYVSGVTRDKEYNLTVGNKGSQVLYFTENPNGEAEVITIYLRANRKLKKLRWEIDFSELSIKGRGVRGNLVTKNLIKKIDLKSKGVSTLKPRKIWFDEAIKRLNTDDRGLLLGEFKPEDRLLLINKRGFIKTIEPILSAHFDDDLILIEKWIPNKPISVIYFEGQKQRYFIKRFVIDSPTREEQFISAHSKTVLEKVFTDYRPMAEIIFRKKELKNLTLNIEEFISIKGIKTIGNQLATDSIKKINSLESLPYQEEDIENIEVEVEESSNEASQNPPDNEEDTNQETLF